MSRNTTVNQWPSWYLTMPKLAVGLLVVLLISLFWLLRQNETEEQRTSLIADLLWLEQNLRFHLQGSADQFQQLSVDMGQEAHPEAMFEARARHLIKTIPELEHITWLDATGTFRTALPTPTSPRQLTSTDSRKGNSPNELIDISRKLAKPLFSDPFRTEEGVYFEVYMPIFRHGKIIGTLIGSYAASILINQHVPWWFAEKYQLRLLDRDGQVLASKSNAEHLAPSTSYQIELDPPGRGVAIQAIAYRSQGNTAQTVIATVIVLLAGAVLWSLFAIRGLIRRRLDAEQALRTEHAFRKAMEDSLTVGMRARDLDGVVTYVNQAFCDMTGFTAEELIGTPPPMPYWAPEEMLRTKVLHDAVLEGKAPEEGFELRFQKKNGERFDALIYEAPLIDANGQHTGWMGSVLDVTERKRAEELARQQQEKLQMTSRLMTMGEMASTLAHELNQPLAAIASYNTGCLNKLESGNYTPEELSMALGKLGVQAQRAGQIIRRVHDFVRKSEPKRIECDLAEVIDDSIGFMEPEARKRHVRIERSIQGNRPPLHADPVMLEQVLMNLIRNGIEAMAETPPPLRLLTVSMRVLEHQFEVRVSDCGHGIRPEISRRLFTPFQSTKASGMGMGLSISRSIIEFHQGRLWAEPRPEGGSDFVFTLSSTSA